MPVQNTIGVLDPYMSLGLSAPTDFTTNFPFIDLMLTARNPFFGYENGQYFTDYLDGNGWAHTVPDTGPITYHFDWGSFTQSDDAGAFRYPELVQNQSGNYVLEYHGEGHIEIRALDTIYTDDDGDGRIEFSIDPVTVTENGAEAHYFGFDVVITATGAPGDYDPANPTHIRDISIIREEHEDLFEAGALFNPEWLEVIDDFRSVRFMDWMQTNDSPLTRFEDFADMDSASWAEAVPLEVQVKLANQIGADPWFNIPHELDADGTRQFVEYVRDNLDPNLVPTFEYSNEVWNPIFEQHVYAQERAVEWFGDDAYLVDSETGSFVLDGTGAPIVSHYATFNAQMVLATQTAQIVQSVYDETPELQYINTVGVSSGLGGAQDVMDQYLFAPMWAVADNPDMPAYTAPHEVFDTVAATSYFGGALLHENFDQFNAAIDAHLADTEFDIHGWLLDYVMGTNADLTNPATGQIDNPDSIPALVSTLSDMAYAISGTHPNGTELSLGLTLYEGGQHLIHETPFLFEQATDDLGNPVLDVNGDPVIVPIENFDVIQDVLLDFVRGDLITEAYQALSDAWSDIGDGAFVQYGDVKLPGLSGAFDLLAHHDDETPLSNMLYDLNATAPVTWEDRGGTQFQQGLRPDLDGADVYAGFTDLLGDDLIEGTTAEDLLMGGAGNDTLIGYDEIDQGHSGDTLAGGAGNDVLQAGAGTDYLNGGLGNDVLTGGDGDDLFLFSPMYGDDTITDFDATVDVLNFDGQIITDLNTLPSGMRSVVTETGTLLVNETGGSVLLQGYFGHSAEYYVLEGPDAQLFLVDSESGVVSPQDWFTPSFDDPWDIDENHIYEVSVVGLGADGTEVSRSDLEMVVSAEGVVWQDAENAPVTGGGTVASYDLVGPDAQLFVVDATTGEISNQDWFTPSFDDPWDSDEDHVYQVSRLGLAEDGSEVSRTELEMVVTADSASWREVGGGDTGGSGDLSYTLDGPDAHLFIVDGATGTVSTQDWFTPSYDDPWDIDEDHIYEIAVLGLNPDGTEASRSDLEMVVSADGVVWQEAQTSTGEELLAGLFSEDAATAYDDPAPEEDAIDDGVLDF